MSIIAWVLVGLIAGFVASKLVDHHGKGIVLDVVLGIAGAIVGGLLFRLVGSPGITGFNLWSMFVAMIGSILLLVVGRIFSRGRPT